MKDESDKSPIDNDTIREHTVALISECTNSEVTEPASDEKEDGSFVFKADGVYFKDQDKHGNLTNTRICSRLEIVAETQTAAGENYGRLLKWMDSKGRVHRWAMPAELAHSDSNEHIRYLVSRGLEIKPSRFCRQKVSEYIASSEPDKTVICTDKLGWQDDLFVLPEGTIGRPKQDESVIFQSAFPIGHRFQTKGTLEKWQQNVSRLCAGNSRLVFSVSTAFAACLLTPLQEGGGGFHLRGSSSLGKTTALLVGGSVWGGDPKQGFLTPWRTTVNGLESVAQLHNDGLLCLDELKECDPRAAAEIAYMLANGRGKVRMNRNISARASLTWLLLFLSSGELSLSDLVEQNGGRVYGGQEVRMCDIPADAGNGFGLFEKLHDLESAELFAKLLTENAKKYYGSPIRAFLKYVTDNAAAIKTGWMSFRKAFMQSVLPEDAGGEIQRVASRFALVAYGGYLARDVCGWTDEEAETACKTVFGAWLSNRSGSGQTDAENAVKSVRHFLELHGNSRFQDLSSGLTGDESSQIATDMRINNRVGYKQKNHNGETEYLIFPVGFQKEVCKGFDHKMVAKELNLRGYLETEQGRQTKQKKIDGINQRFYVIKSTIFGGN